MRREWTVAAAFLAFALAGTVAGAQPEREAPAQQAERQRFPDPAPRPEPAQAAAVAPVYAPGPDRTSSAPAPRFADEGQARPRTGGSSATSGSRGRSGSSSGGATATSRGRDSQGRQRAPAPSAGASDRGGRPPSAAPDTSSDSGSRAARRRYPYNAPDGSLSRGPAIRRPPGSGYYGGRWYYPSHPWYGSWYPYGIGSWGLGFYMWDPYWYPGYGPYGWGGYGYVGRYDETGALRIIVKPREAQVFVDGYYVGVVDEFDGIFQRLRLDTGPHRIEVRMEGFETLRYDVRVTYGHTITLRGLMKAAAPEPEP